MTALEKNCDINNSAYRSYNKTQNKRIIMNKMLVDSGYPQDVFVKNISHKSQDFIEDNKKNLKNFFKDRLPQNQFTKDTLKVKNISFDPLKIFQFKRLQFQLKHQTKITLDQTFLEKNKTKINDNTKNMKKVQEIFFINDKTLQLKKKFQSLNIPRFDSYNKNNHRRGTQSFMEKRSKLLKRQAYDRVFGADISSISRTLPLTPNIEQVNPNKKSSRKIRYSNRRHSRVQEPETKRQDLSNLIKKIDDFKNKIKPVKLHYQQQSVEKSKGSNDENMLRFSKFEEEHIKSPSDIQENKQKVISLIQNITDLYKRQAVEGNRTKITSLDDLEKLDSNFYQQLNRHKKNRMQKRMYELYKYNLPESNDLINSKLNVQTQNIENFQQRNKKKRNISDIISITDNEIDDQQKIIDQSIEVKKRKTIHERFRYLGTHLIKAHLQSNFYMVKPSFFYPAFWEERKPFQMEGSYAFFKAIKLNDFQCLKSFISIDLNYLYEKDMHGRTPLIYACLHNKQKIVDYFLNLGSNVDKMCNNKKTALFYALQNKNIDIVRLLLQYGANPWSNNYCLYDKKIKQIKQNNFQIVFSNAKKIYLAVRLQIGSKRRKQFWHQNKMQINQHTKIQF